MESIETTSASGADIAITAPGAFEVNGMVTASDGTVAESAFTAPDARLLDVVLDEGLAPGFLFREARQDGTPSNTGRRLLWPFHWTLDLREF